jgi:hypothetical protein
MNILKTMITTVTGKNMVSIPRSLADRYGIAPGWKFDWAPGGEPDTLIVRLVPDRVSLSRRLRGAGRDLTSAGDPVADLVAERERDE